MSDTPRTDALKKEIEDAIENEGMPYACMSSYSEAEWLGKYEALEIELSSQILEAREAERERCAKVCEAYAKSGWEDHKNADMRYAGQDCAAAIRATKP